MNKNQYFDYFNSMLSDSSTYIKLRKDPTSEYQKPRNDLFSEMKNNGFIDEQTRIKNKTPVSPKLYGLKKTHKPPLRPVVRCLDSLLYKISVLFHNMMPVVTKPHTIM